MPQPFGRRRFVQGMAATASLAAVPRSVMADTLLSGRDFALEIGPVPVNITGRARTAIGINGTVPGPILRWREGDTVTLAVTNRLAEATSIHWHGLRVPSSMDGVPGLSFAGIAPGDTFTYRFPVHQSGTYWYHSHSAYQEQSGLYGAIVVEPKDGYAHDFDRDYVVLLSDWSDDSPETIVSNLKFQSDYYNFAQRTAGTFVRDVRQDGLGPTVANRIEWGKMRMSPTDILDVTGATFTYLLNGRSPASNWTALFRLGERVRLRFINGSSMTIFDVRIPGLEMTVIQADGNDIAPVAVDEFRIGTAETYDVIVRPMDAKAFTVFAAAADRSGYARGTLAPQAGMAADIPPMDARPVLGMTDMGMGDMGGMKMDHGSMAGMAMPGMDHGSMAGMNHGSMSGMAMPDDGKDAVRPGVEVDNVAMMPTSRINEPGNGLEDNGRRVLRYTDLRATKPGTDPRPPTREIVLHLTGNMQRYIWGFDGRKFSEAGPIELARGERVRIVLINDTMMQHPIHLHGLWSELENGEDTYRPYKHTILVKPGERLTYLVTADVPGRWAYHCHLLYHMEMGMFREVRVA